MRKFIVITVLALLFVAPLAMVSPVLAANEFVADGSITVSSVAGSVTADMTILTGSTAYEWGYSSGTFTVTNPGSAFKVACSDTSAIALKVADSNGDTVACTKNINPGTSYVTLPITADTYTITPSSINIAYATSYNSTCGAATCETNYTVSGSGSSATCASSLGGSTGGGGAPPSTQAPTYQTYDPTTGELTEGEPAAEEAVAEAPASVVSQEAVSAVPGVAAVDETGKVTLGQMTADATTVAGGGVGEVVAEMGVARDLAQESTYNETIVAKVVVDTGITAQVRNTITSFVTYGTKSTKILGAGERAGVVNSFKAALSKLPTTTEDWNDVIKIANGRWPSQTSEQAESDATATFKKIYLRDPDRTNAHDDAAVTVMAYGLRPAGRNLDSEKAAIKIFKNIYGYNPTSATDWDATRAIAYSGATR